MWLISPHVSTSNMDLADISTITLVYSDQPSPPSPSPPSPPSSHNGSLSYGHTAVPDFLNTLKMDVDVEEGHIPKVDDALFGSQELEVSIPDNDIENCARKQGPLLPTSDSPMSTDHGNLNEGMVRGNCDFLSRWDEIGK